MAVGPGSGRATRRPEHGADSQRQASAEAVGGVDQAGLTPALSASGCNFRPITLFLGSPGGILLLCGLRGDGKPWRIGTEGSANH